MDLDRLAQNLERMAAYAALHGLALRPHVKTHKSPRIAAEQMRLGAVGLTCATPREAEVMSDVSRDVLVAYPIVGVPKLARLVSLPANVRLTVAVDSETAVEQLAEAAREGGREVDVYVELDLGMHRVGVPNVDQAIALARQVLRHPRLRYAGITFYPGHIRGHVDEQHADLQRLANDISAAIKMMDRAGVRPAAVSGGSTPAAWRMHEIEGLTEVRPGTYVYNDRGTAALGACTWDDCAFTVLATVVSTAVAGQAVVDAGSKALGREPMRGVEGEGFGALLDRPDVTVQRMSEEHGIIDLKRTDWRPEVGEQVRIVPNHVCVVVHLNDVMYGVRGDVVEATWPVAARGRAEFSPIAGA
ncbi:MAG TPA: alanine racemase [Gemmatimonadaceae bacterium]|nr:alanine racemase [Gemmatimonadaceae bacterium]